MSRRADGLYSGIGKGSVEGLLVNYDPKWLICKGVTERLNVNVNRRERQPLVALLEDFRTERCLVNVVPGLAQVRVVLVAAARAVAAQAADVRENLIV